LKGQFRVLPDPGPEFHVKGHTLGISKPGNGVFRQAGQVEPR
jgi:hypothetical protein